MSDITALNPESAGAVPGDAADGLRRLAQVRVELSVEIGRTRMSLGEALALGPGSVIALDRMADQPVDLLVNGKLVARGEVVVIDSEYGLRVTEVVGAQAEGPADLTALPVSSPTPAPAPAPEPAAEPEGAIDQAAIDAAIAAAAAGGEEDQVAA